MTSGRPNQFLATVLRNVPLCRDHYRLILHLADFPATAPGQFIQITCNEPDIDEHPSREFDWSPGNRLDLSPDDSLPDDSLDAGAMLRRPFSLAGRRDVEGGVEIDIIHRVVGIGTRWLAELDSGDSVGILGPLGNQFTLPPRDAGGILVGGGVGIPPMLYLAGAMAGRAIAFAGAMARDLLPLTVTAEPSKSAAPLDCIDEFSRHGIPAVIATDDGSCGFRGFVTQALEAYLDRNAGRKAVLYTCGPEPMMKRVADIAIRRNIPCQVAVERAMACGMGTCQSCCIRVKKSVPADPPLAGSDWCYRLICTDGPIFQAASLLW